MTMTTFKQILLFVSFSMVFQHIHADDIWPWSVKFMVSKGEEIVENEASLWIANPDKPLRGVILTSMVRNEVEFNYSEEIRNAAREKDLALLFFYNERSGDFYTGGAMSIFDIEKGHDTVIVNVLNKFADITGKPEIAHAPWMTFGHSTAGIFARNIAWWKPERMFGVIFYKTGGYHPPEWIGNPDTANFLNIPWLSVAARNDKYGPGEQGWKNMRKDMMPWRKRGALMSEIVEPTLEEGHSKWRSFNAPYFAMWIKKAVDRKIPNDSIAESSPVELLHINNSTGVLSDTLLEFLMDSSRIHDDLLRYHHDVEPEERGNRFWHFDDETAITWVNYHHKVHGEFTPRRDTIITGTLKYWYRRNLLPFDPSEPQKYDSTVIMGMNSNQHFDSSSMVLPNTSGKFELTGYDRRILIRRDMAGSYQKPNTEKSVLDKINGMDAFLLEEIIQEQDDYIVPSVFQIWAADVNMDGIVDQQDLAQLSSRAILQIPEFKQLWNYNGQEQPEINYPSKDWVFYDSAKTRFHIPTRLSRTYPDDDGTGYSRHRIPPVSDTVIAPYKPGNPYPQFLDGIFYGTMLGDLDGSFAFTEDDRTDSRIILDFANAETFNGDSTYIPLLIESDQPVYAADLKIRVDTSNMNIVRFDAIAVDNLYSHGIGNENYMISWSSTSIETTMPFANMVLQNVETSHEDISIATGYINGKPCNIEMTMISSDNAKKILSNEEIFIYPVPADKFIYVRMPENVYEKIALIIYDTSGKKVLTKEVFYNSIDDLRIDISGMINGTYVAEIRVGAKAFRQVFSIQ